MAFSESLKQSIRKKSLQRCCVCQSIGVEIHHIIPQDENGSDNEDNAAPLCPSCHDIYGSNPSKRKFIRECRNNWYEVCLTRYTFDDSQLKNILREYVTREEFEGLKTELTELKEKNVAELTFLQKLFSSLFSIPPLIEAKILIKKKEYEPAKVILEKELSVNNANNEVYYLLGYICGELNDYDNMILFLNNSLQLNSKYKKNIQDILDYYWAINFNKGVEYFNKAKSISIIDEASLSFIKSQEYFEIALKCKPDSESTIQNIIYVLINNEKSKDAIPYLQRLINNYNSEMAYSMLGQVYIEQANLEKDITKSKELFEVSINVLEEGRKHYPNSNELLQRLSNAYIGANKLDVAFNIFQLGTELEPDNKYYRFNYGVLLLNSNNYLEAHKQFLKAIELDKNYNYAIYNLAVTYLRWGFNDEEHSIDQSGTDKYKFAVKYFEEYLSQFPNEFQIWEILGKIYQKLGMEIESKNAFEKGQSFSSCT